jgi:hypothetical protein
LAVTILTGLQDDSTILANRRVIDMNPVVAMLDPEQSQFSTMLMKLSSKPAFSQKVEWIEDQLLPRVSTLAASATSAAASISVATDTGSYFKLNDICRIVSTGEAVSVSAAPSGDTVGIARAVGAVTAASAASGGDIVILGNASLEGGSLPVRKMTKKTNAYNYCQIVRSSYGFTNTLAASKLYGGSEPNVERQKKAVEHKRQIESLLFFGARSLNVGGANPQGFVGGAIEYISTNIKNPAGQVTKATFDGYLDSLFAHGDSSSKVFFAAPLPARIISTYGSAGLGSAWGNGDLASASAKFGVHVNGFISGAYGYDLPIIVKREWNDMASTTSGYGSYGFGIDLSCVKLRPLRDTVLLTNRQANDADTIDEEYLSELSLEFQVERNHLLMKGATS